MVCRHAADLHQLRLIQRHTRRADLGHAPAKLIFRHGAQALGVSVREVRPPAAVKVQVRQSGNQQAAFQIHFPAAGLGYNALPLYAEDTVDKSLMRVKYPRTGQPHTVAPASTSL